MRYYKKTSKTVPWIEFAATVTKHDNVVVNSLGEKCLHEKFYSKIPYYAKHLGNFGEMKSVQSIASIKYKLEG